MVNYQDLIITDIFIVDDTGDKGSGAEPKVAQERTGPGVQTLTRRRLFQAMAMAVRWHVRIVPAVMRWARIEQGRLALFVPVLFAIGIGWYFALAAEPSSGQVAGVVIGVWVCWRVVRVEAPGLRLGLAAAAIMAAGFGSAKVRTMMVGAPVLDHEINYADVMGTVVSVEHRARGWRVVIKPTSIEGLAPERLPARIRINWRGTDFAARAGQTITIRAGLAPPPLPVMPGGYDFGRQLYFQRIGAVGYGLSPPVIVPDTQVRGAAARLRQRIPVAIEKLRSALFQRIRAKAPGEGGAIVAAIVTGKREAIPADAIIALRDSGLAHLLAISGLHMGIATGLIFFVVRFLLVLNTRLALTQPIKKWAAIAALASGVFYLIISGSGWSARRAFVMSTIIFIAILTDRRALSLRNVAVAAMVILIFTPEALLHPGFQMSFAAVIALVATYEWVRERSLHQSLSFEYGDSAAPPIAPVAAYGTWGWRWGRLKKYTLAIAITDSVAALATAPFALYHFNRTAIYSLPANMLATPLMGLWIMPAIIMALVVMPVGLDGFFWRLAGAGIDVILVTGRSVAALPGAVSMVSDQSLLWLVMVSAGGAGLCLLRAPWRLAGLAVIVIAGAMMVVAPKPALLISGEGHNVGVLLDHEGRSRLAVFDRRRGRFSTMVWMESFGLDGGREQVLAMYEVLGCDEQGCVVELKGRKIAISAHPLGLGEDCVHADIVVALYPVHRRLAPQCAALLLDQRGAWAVGARALWLADNGRVRVRSVRGAGTRPW